MTKKNHAIFIAACAVTAVIGCGLAYSQGIANFSGNHFVIRGSDPTNVVISSRGVYTSMPPQLLPAGAVYHQVVDIYYDDEGNKLETASDTHRVDSAYCHGGVRNMPADLLAQDDGHGNVRFVQARLPSEPAAGQRPITDADRVHVLLANKASAPLTPDPQLVSR